MTKNFIVGSVLIALVAANPARAFDLPAIGYRASPATVSPSGFYIWADGSWQSVNLPAVGLGFRGVNSAAPNDLGPVQPIGTRADGFGIRAAVGYFLPQGSYANGWGSNARFEVGARLVDASASQDVAGTVTSPGLGVQTLDGTIRGAALGGFLCTTGGFTCAVAGSLQTRYETWEVNGKLASDFQVGTVKVTPSVTIFGVAGRSDQTLSQSFTQFAGGAVFRNGFYNATTSLHWRDVGARTGLDASMAVNNWLSVDAGGYLGLALRNVSLSANDVSYFPAGFFNGASAISTSANATALIANAEVGFRVKPWTMREVTFRGFGGLNFDDQVPGILPASYTGSYSAATATSAAGISFQSMTSYYAGAGVLVRFP
jgi:hypothetical protein